MYKDVVVETEVTMTYKYCDVCGTGIVIGLACSKAKCECCEKDLCDKCVGHEGYAGGDYRVVYCKKCWEIGDDYRDEIKMLEAKVEELYEEWRQRCVCNKS